MSESKDKFSLALSDDGSWYRFRIKTENKVRKIAARRMIALTGHDPYSSDIKVALDLLGLWKTDLNDAMQLGMELEKPILDAFLQGRPYKSFSYEEYKGDCFNDPTFSGLLDAWDPETKTIYEVKTYGYKEKWDTWFLQLAFYKTLWPEAEKAMLLAYKINRKTDKVGAQHKVNRNLIQFRELPGNIDVASLKEQAIAKRDELFALQEGKPWTYEFLFQPTEQGIKDVNELRKKSVEWGLKEISETDW